MVLELQQFVNHQNLSQPMTNNNNQDQTTVNVNANENDNDDFVRLESPPPTRERERESGTAAYSFLANYNENWGIRSSRSRWLWVQISVIFLIFAVLCYVLVRKYGPRFMEKEVIPVINWLSESCSPLVLAAIVFCALALLPILLLPTTPFKWIAGMTFGYGLGYLLIVAGVSFGVTFPYFIGYHLFLPTIKRWLDKHPKEAAIARLAGDGDWLHQFRAIALIRLSPFPYVVFNYAAVATGVKYTPYLAGTVLGMIPEIFVAIYSGILIRTVAEAMQDDTPVSRYQILVDGIGFCVSAAATVIVGFYAKGKLKQMQEEEEQQHQLLP